MGDVEEPVRGSVAEPSFQALQRPAASLVQTKPVLQQIKRDPYIFIAHHYVPVLNATVAHLKKRLRGYGWKDILADSTGYYVIFEDSQRGQLAAVKCYSDCHMAALFIYVMDMECQQHGNPNYERSPSPVDLEKEKRQRAKDTCPANEAIEVGLLESDSVRSGQVTYPQVYPSLPYDCRLRDGQRLPPDNQNTNAVQENVFKEEEPKSSVMSDVRFKLA